MTIHNYQLELTKPANIRGSIHGKIEAYQEIYSFMITKPISRVSILTLEELKRKLKDLGCTNLEVKSDA